MTERPRPARSGRAGVALAGQALGLAFGLAISPGSGSLLVPLSLLAAVCSGRYLAMALLARRIGSGRRGFAGHASFLWLLGFALTALAGAAIARRFPEGLAGIVAVLLGGPAALWLSALAEAARSILAPPSAARAPGAGPVGEGGGA